MVLLLETSWDLPGLKWAQMREMGLWLTRRVLIVLIQEGCNCHPLTRRTLS